LSIDCDLVSQRSVTVPPLKGHTLVAIIFRDYDSSLEKFSSLPGVLGEFSSWSRALGFSK